MGGGGGFDTEKIRPDPLGPFHVCTETKREFCRSGRELTHLPASSRPRAHS